MSAPGPESAAGPGRARLGLVLTAQLAVAAILPRATPHAPAAIGLSGAALAQEPFGPAGALGARAWRAGAAAQIHVAVDRPAWVAALWFEGERLIALHPETPATDDRLPAGTPLAIPPGGRWLRLTPGEGELYVVAAESPEPAVLDAVADGAGGRVSALRRTLRAAAGTPQDTGVAQWLPTPDGRALPLPWQQTRGRLAVLRWPTTVLPPAGDLAAAAP